MRIVFMGTPDFAVPSLEKLIDCSYEIMAVVTQPDRPRGRGQKTTPPPVKAFAHQHGLLVAQPESVNEETFVERLTTWRPDCVVVVAFGQILKRSALAVSPLGCVNVHASLLPRYRGAAPIHRAILNGDSSTGVTTMKMNERMDAGDLLLQQEIPIHEGDTTGIVEQRLAVVGASLLVETLQNLQAGTVSPSPQEESGATFAPLIRNSDGAMRWTHPARVLHNQVRGLNPSPGAFTQLAGRLLKVWRTEVAEPGSVTGSPGQVVGLDPEGFPRVQTGEGWLRLNEVQPQDRKRMGGDEWARGARLQGGEQLHS